MRLLSTHRLELETFFGEPPRYAILSHTWTSSEILFEDIKRPRREWENAPGAYKVLQSARKASSRKLDYIWIDTCCIDKSSSAELSEAINSMYRWYQKSVVCFAYLSDVHNDDAIGDSRWLTRGWTLQELIAPSLVEFYNSSWSLIGERGRLASILQRVTGIDVEVLTRGTTQSDGWLEEYSVHRRMSWAAKRTTTREEDVAYCLLGLFDINMPLLYGEGGIKAFRRLQEEILKHSPDQSILVHLNSPLSQTLAASPACFKEPLKVIKGEGSVESRVRMREGVLDISLILCQMEEKWDGHNMAIGGLDCFVEVGSTTITRPAILLLSHRDGWYRFSHHVLYMLHPGDRDVATVYPKGLKSERDIKFLEAQRQNILIYDIKNQSALDTNSTVLTGDATDRVWRRRPLVLKRITQVVDPFQCTFGRCYPAEVTGMISLAHTLAFGPGLSYRAIVWVALSDSQAHRFCAIAIGSRWSSHRLVCEIFDAAQVFPHFYDSAGLTMKDAELAELLAGPQDRSRLPVNATAKDRQYSLAEEVFVGYLEEHRISLPGGAPSLSPSLDLRDVTVTAKLSEMTYLESIFYELSIEVVRRGMPHKTID